MKLSPCSNLTVDTLLYQKLPTTLLVPLSSQLNQDENFLDKYFCQNEIQKSYISVLENSTESLGSDHRITSINEPVRDLRCLGLSW